MHRITGGPFTMWLIETDVMAELGQPVFSLVSRVFLHEHERIIEQLTRTGHELLLCYTLQQIEQFRNRGEDFAMLHAGTEYLEELEDELQKVLDTISVEKRLRGCPQKNACGGCRRTKFFGGFPPGKSLGDSRPRSLWVG